MLAATSFIAVVTLLSTSVSAHGWVGNIIANDKLFVGPEPAYREAAPASPIRQIASEQPVTNINSTLLACGGNATVYASELAPATAGSSVSIQWFNGGSTPQWPHNVGPLLTYLAPCSTSNCHDPSTSLTFFKIAEDGQVPGTNTWVQAQLMNGTRYNVTIPTGVPSGNYIMRHEIIALQNAGSIGGAEHYPSCFQLTITGGESSLPPMEFVSSIPKNETAQFPGAYGSKDPGLYLNVYDTPLDYAAIYPGPPIPEMLTNGPSGSGNLSTTPTHSRTGSPAASTGRPTSGRQSGAIHTFTRSANSSAGHPAGTAPHDVFTTTVTNVVVLTIALDDVVVSTTTGTPYRPTTTPSSNAPKSTVSHLARSHPRRSPGWRAGFTLHGV